MTHRVFKIIAIIALTLGAPALSAGDDLVDVMNSEEMKRMRRLTDEGSREDYRGKWAPAGKNYSMLFNSKSGIENLKFWLGVAESDYKLGRDFTQRFREYLMLKRFYETPEEQQLEITLLVPHPRYVQQVEFDLVEEIARLKPPLLRVESTEEMKIQGQESFLYHTKYKKKQVSICTLFIKLSKEAVLHMNGACDATDHMITLANMLSIERLNGKLES